MRNNNPFQRTGEISREPRKSVDWLEDFAERLALEEQTNQRIKIAGRSRTAVEVARERQEAQPSIYEMMSAIVSGRKPKYSSVEEAVKDYQERTGLAKWQSEKQNEKIADVAHHIVSNADSDVANAFTSDPAKADSELKEFVENSLQVLYDTYSFLVRLKDRMETDHTTTALLMSGQNELTETVRQLMERLHGLNTYNKKFDMMQSLTSSMHGVDIIDDIEKAAGLAEKLMFEFMMASKTEADEGATRGGEKQRYLDEFEHQKQKAIADYPHLKERIEKNPESYISMPGFVHDPDAPQDPDFPRHYRSERLGDEGFWQHFRDFHAAMQVVVDKATQMFGAELDVPLQTAAGLRRIMMTKTSSIMPRKKVSGDLVSFPKKKDKGKKDKVVDDDSIGKLFDLDEERAKRMKGKGPDDDGPGGAGLSGVLMEMPEIGEEDEDVPLAAADDGEKIKMRGTLDLEDEDIAEILKEVEEDSKGEFMGEDFDLELPEYPAMMKELMKMRGGGPGSAPAQLFSAEDGENGKDKSIFKKNLEAMLADIEEELQGPKELPSYMAMMQELEKMQGGGSAPDQSEILNASDDVVNEDEQAQLEWLKTFIEKALSEPEMDSMDLSFDDEETLDALMTQGATSSVMDKAHELNNLLSDRFQPPHRSEYDSEFAGSLLDSYEEDEAAANTPVTTASLYDDFMVALAEDPKKKVR